MKKHKQQNAATKVTVLAGTVAMMAFVAQTHAGSAVDNLLDKLEQKGILTATEAGQLKAENEQETTTKFNQEMNSRFPMPGWITSYKLYGDFRGRFDERTTPNPAQTDNIRLRYRLRAGLTVNMKDNLQVGFRLGSADDNGNGLGGTPLSNNTTLRGNGSKKFLYVDAAYGKWTPINDGTWMVAGTIGKMNNPFRETWMVFDPDYTPEGGALQASYNINQKNSLSFNAAGFVLAWSGSAAQNMSFLYGAQALWNAHWTDHLSSSLGVAAYNIVNRDLLTKGMAGAGNAGNTLGSGSDGTAPLYNFNPIVADASVTYRLDSFPLYPGAFPIKFLAEYMNNPAAPGSGAGVASGNQGYYAGILFGQAGKKGTWDIGYRYQSLDANAWYAQIVDDDNADYAMGFAGGTNVKGHLLTVDYAVTDALLFSFHCYVNSMIGNTNPGGASSGAIHAMADLMWKF